MSLDKKPAGFSFGFSKTKAKTTVVQTTAFKDESKLNESEKVEIITSIEGKKVTSLNKSSNDPKKPIVIPCQKNQNLLDKHRASKTNLNPEKLLEGNSEDLEAVKALIEKVKAKKESKEDDSLVIPINSKEEDKVKDEFENVEEANYEAIDLEQFGKAALRGMGWNEKEGIGMKNKRVFSMVEPELRPKGLGLGAGFGKKQKSSADTEESESKNGNSLRYAKGAFVEILNGKHKDEFGQIVSFDDGLNRILVKLFEDDQTISILQNFTRLISKSDYESIQKKNYKKR